MNIEKKNCFYFAYYVFNILCSVAENKDNFMWLFMSKNVHPKEVNKVSDNDHQNGARVLKEKGPMIYSYIDFSSIYKSDDEKYYYCLLSKFIFDYKFSSFPQCSF